ncbi:threonine-phosphate decarboxylase CobD [Azomonas macrocytogenes]|uniref:threonine-phosphate decarboxylase n=1 Tax=Azomonas macrocytogenes TaxID=69962 RepID=A0A839T740_AZOMA|nr:threonine-phosphate decarboxylase CobD [Azomonas macrocytogenes]MBB3104266.1 cobalamin biosynthetic protein CobC [Azomonas macrocytogenes]
MLEHGGRLHQAARRYGITRADWLDLSTGIAPYSLALPDIPLTAWARLPEPDDELEAAARSYYNAASLLPVAGSQTAIQALPRLRAPSRVGILAPCYAEHAQAWQRAGHELIQLDEQNLPAALDTLDVLLVVNPNNPSGRLLAPERLLEWQAWLARRGGWLIVDEAFMDCTPQASLARQTGLPGLIVLRSFGKFFGMAGARLGFVLGEKSLLEALNEQLGPWPIAGPTRVIACAQLQDAVGQHRQRERLHSDGQRLADLLTQHALPPAGGCALFQWLRHPQAAELHATLARQGILTRLFHAPSSLRLGLPPDVAGWARLEQALTGWKAA